MGGEGFLIDIFSLEEGAVDGGGGTAGAQGAEVVGEIGVVDTHACYGSHRGLHGLGTVGIDGAGGADDVLDAEPVGNADDGAQVAGVLHVVEGEAEFAFGNAGGELAGGELEEGQHLLWGLEEAGLAQFVGGDGNDFGSLGMGV